MTLSTAANMTDIPYHENNTVYALKLLPTSKSDIRFSSEVTANMCHPFDSRRFAGIKNWNNAQRNQRNNAHLCINHIRISKDTVAVLS